MRLSQPFVLASIAAIALGGFMFWLHQEYVLNLSFIFSNVPLREVYRETGLPPSIQSYVDYRYVLAVVFAIAAFEAVYYELMLKSFDRTIISVCFLVPTVINYFFMLTVFLSPILILGLLIRAVFLNKNQDTQRYRVYLLCSIFNCISAIAVYVHINEAFRITS
ncbi:hypothetical protein LEP3755_46740 [Leptolyngbya sp. NIES-3755]|nr:hypothetical protein LEP3755_46740 [Leptolyngbya sp. NIES-3755]